MSAGNPKIWCLFSIENNYDQPDHNLVRWWSRKPGVIELCEVIDYETARSLLQVGEAKEIAQGWITNFWLAEVEEGSPVPCRT